jgi:putative ABC transport system substrate-binding protein
MRRREFVTLLGGAAMWPLAARAQQPGMPVIGFLGGVSPTKTLLVAFRQGLNDAGYSEGKNVAIEFRSADGQLDRLPALADDLVRRRVAVIVAAGAGNTATLAAKAATTEIPIVFLSGFDPVRLGFVASLSRPGGNLTGVNLFGSELGPKRLELLRELIPTATKIGLLVNPDSASVELEIAEMQAAAHAVQRQLLVLNQRTERDIDAAYEDLGRQRADALVVSNDGSLLSRADQLVALSARQAVPTIYARREFAEAGGLMSYGTSLAEGYRQQGIYTGRILKGEKPADLPVMQSTKFELVINLKTAKALGLTVPPSVLAIADEVIE